MYFVREKDVEEWSVAQISGLNRAGGKQQIIERPYIRIPPPLRLARLHEVDLAVLWPPIPDGELCWL